MSSRESYDYDVRTRVWLSVAELHMDKGIDETFDVPEIINKVKCVEAELGLNNIKDKSIKNNVYSYCRSNRVVPPSCKYKKAHKHRMLYKEKTGFRLWHPDDEYKDDYEKDRECGLTVPKNLNKKHEKKYMIWYNKDYCKGITKSTLNATGNYDSDGVRTERLPIDPQGHVQADKRNNSADQEPVGVVDLSRVKGGPPPWATQVLTRVVRDTAKVRNIKKMYNNECQVCGHTIQVADNHRYSEVHHLLPLGGGYNGDDDYDNMLVLCPTHHVEFDYAVLGVSSDKRTVVDRDGKQVGSLNMLGNHELASKNIKRHMERMKEAGAVRGSPQA